MAARRTSPARSTPRWPRQITGRPVKILYSRDESLRFHPKRHATIIRVQTGAKRDGTLTAVEAELYGDSGAYASLGEKVMTRATTHATGPYVVVHAKIDCYAMYTNNAPCGAFRGFGVTQIRLRRGEQHGHPGRGAGHGPGRPAPQKRHARGRHDRHRPSRCAKAWGCWNCL